VRSNSSKPAKASTRDNSLLREKVALRKAAIEGIGKKTVSILECCCGEGAIYRTLETDISLNITKIDVRTDLKGVYLVGDNRRFLKTLDLSRFDVIDVDGHGVPFEQLEIIINSGFVGTVVATMIETGVCGVPFKLLAALGIVPRGAANLFRRQSRKYLFYYLGSVGVRSVTAHACDYVGNVKTYFYFTVGNSGELGNDNDLPT
jgi:hypothetical protein